MTYQIHRIHIWPVVRITFVFFLLLGLIFGALYLMIMGMFANFMAYTGDADIASEFFQLSGFMGVAGIFFMACLHALIWSVLITVLLMIYNLFGGIQVDIDKTDSLLEASEITDTKNPPQDSPAIRESEI